MFPQWAGAVHSPLPHAPQPVLEISLGIGKPRSGRHGWRYAQVRGGFATGSLLQASVRQGQLEWLVDPASGAVQVAADLLLVRGDGALIRLRDRSAHADGAPGGYPGLATAPELFDAAGMALLPGPLAGLLDASGLGRRLIQLRAFAQG
jgi:hypothetical protein